MSLSSIGGNSGTNGPQASGGFQSTPNSQSPQSIVDSLNAYVDGIFPNPFAPDQPTLIGFLGSVSAGSQAAKDSINEANVANATAFSQLYGISATLLAALFANSNALAGFYNQGNQGYDQMETAVATFNGPPNPTSLDNYNAAAAQLNTDTTALSVAQANYNSSPTPANLSTLNSAISTYNTDAATYNNSVTALNGAITTYNDVVTSSNNDIASANQGLLTALGASTYASFSGPNNLGATESPIPLLPTASYVAPTDLALSGAAPAATVASIGGTPIPNLTILVNYPATISNTLSAAYADISPAFTGLLQAITVDNSIATASPTANIKKSQQNQQNIQYWATDPLYPYLPNSWAPDIANINVGHSAGGGPGVGNFLGTFMSTRRTIPVRSQQNSVNKAQLLKAAVPKSLRLGNSQLLVQHHVAGFLPYISLAAATSTISTLGSSKLGNDKLRNTTLGLQFAAGVNDFLNSDTLKQTISDIVERTSPLTLTPSEKDAIKAEFGARVNLSLSILGVHQLGTSLKLPFLGADTLVNSPNATANGVNPAAARQTFSDVTQSPLIQTFLIKAATRFANGYEQQVQTALTAALNNPNNTSATLFQQNLEQLLQANNVPQNVTNSVANYSVAYLNLEQQNGLGFDVQVPSAGSGFRDSTDVINNVLSNGQLSPQAENALNLFVVGSPRTIRDTILAAGPGSGNPIQDLHNANSAVSGLIVRPTENATPLSDQVRIRSEQVYGNNNVPLLGPSQLTPEQLYTQLTSNINLSTVTGEDKSSLVADLQANLRTSSPQFVNPSEGLKHGQALMHAMHPLTTGREGVEKLGMGGEKRSPVDIPISD